MRFKFLALLSILLAALVVLPGHLTLQAQNGVPGRTTGNLNIRSGPKPFAPAFDTITAHTDVTVLARDLNSTWFFIRAGEKEGWISASFLDVFGQVPQGTASGTITGTVNVRWSPNFSLEPITQLEEGDVVIISGQDETGSWYFVERPDDKFGWVSANFINVTAGNIAGAPIWMGVESVDLNSDDDDTVSTPMARPGVLNNNAAMFIRIANPINRTQIRTLNNGQSVTVLGLTVTSENIAYYLVRTADGTLGWVVTTAININGSVPEI